MNILKLATIILLFHVHGFSQELISSTRHYQVLVECPIYECNILGEKISEKPNITPINSVFTLISDLSSEFVIIRFWEWDATKDSTLNEVYHDSDKGPESKKYFLLAKSHLSSNTVKYSKGNLGFLIGSTALPLKIRFSPFDFSTDYHLGHLVGLKYKISNVKENYLDFFGAFGISHIGVDSTSTNGNITQPSNRAAITPSVGVALEIGNVMIGAFLGADYISKNEGIDWIHHGKPWFSIGFGISFVGNKANNNSTEGNN